MKQILKITFSFLLIFGLFITLTACKSKNEVSSENSKKALINDVNYTSLTEAVNNAKSGDTIKIYNDIKDNKNVVITKPLKIKGISTSSQIKPKFYGSITIDLEGEQDYVEIENLEIIHEGTPSDGKNNDTTIGINLIDGGFTLKSSNIGLKSKETADPNASGIVISREAKSINTMPINITGNSFELYKTNNKGQSSALIIKSNKDGVFKKLILNESEIYNQNNFSTKDEGNQLISINYSTPETTYSYFATSSAEEFIKALKSHQDPNGSIFNLYAGKELSVKEKDSISCLEKTNLYVTANSPIDFGGLEINVAGSLLLEGDIKNLTTKETSNTASIIKDTKK